jgi:hypothetical protein
MKHISISKNVVLTIALSATCAFAAPFNSSGDPVFFLGPIGQGLGGAVYSVPTFHDSLLVNASSGAFTKEYHASGSFSTAARTLGASIFDTKSTEYGGGLTYLRREVGSSDTNKPLKAGSMEQLYQSFGLSIFGKLVESLAVSVTGKYSMRSNTGLLNLNGKTWNGDVGATFRVSEKLALGVSYRNMFGDNKNLDSSVIGGGAHLEIYPGLTLTGALEKFSNTGNNPQYGVPDDDRLLWVLGAQYIHTSGLCLRGAFRDAAPWNSQMTFAGIGYRTDSFHVDYAFGTVNKGDKFTVHTFGLGATF